MFRIAGECLGWPGYVIVSGYLLAWTAVVVVPLSHLLFGGILIAVGITLGGGLWLGLGGAILTEARFQRLERQAQEIREEEAAIGSH